MHTNRQPDQAKEEVEHHKANRELEYGGVQPRGKVVNRDGNHEHGLRNGPYDCSPLDVRIVHATGEVNFPNIELGDDIVRG